MITTSHTVAQRRTAGATPSRNTGCTQCSPCGSVTSAVLAGRYASPSAAVLASISQSSPDASTSARNAQPNASYHGSTYGHANSHATTRAVFSEG